LDFGENPHLLAIALLNSPPDVPSILKRLLVLTAAGLSLCPPFGHLSASAELLEMAR
jgi:hypothetical protein